VPVRDDWHRHHRPPRGTGFAIGVADGEVLVGVAMAGRPFARMLDDGLTLEVTRVATDGHRNACSLLYAAAWQAARAMGYRRLVTYTQKVLGFAIFEVLEALNWSTVGRRSSLCRGSGSRIRDPPGIDMHASECLPR
jgi:hypothetical protein